MSDELKIFLNLNQKISDPTISLDRKKEILNDIHLLKDVIKGESAKRTERFAQIIEENQRELEDIK